MRFTFVPVRRKPCTTYAPTPRMVTGVFTGTLITEGENENCWRTSLTTAEPSGCMAVPRLDSTNSPARGVLSGWILSKLDGGASWYKPTLKAKVATIRTVIAQTTITQ